MICVPSKDSDQPRHPQILHGDAQADLVAQPDCWFCHVAAQI